MKLQKLWYFAALFALAMLPLAGCSGGGGSAVGEKGYSVTVGGQVDTAAAKSAGKTAALSPYSTAAANTVYVIDAQVGTVLTSGPIAADGSFKGLSFTMASAKSILVFKAVVASGTVRTIVPVDLSTPPAGLSASNSITININKNTDTIARNVSQFLGLSGILGDGGQTLASVSKTYADAVTVVASNGGQTLAYSGDALVLSGQVNTELLPAQDASTFSNDDLNNVVLDGKVLSAFIPGKNPIVNFQVTNKATGKGISGLKSFNLHVAKLIPAVNGSNSYWVNYIDKGISLPAPLAFAVANAKAVTGAITKPSADPALTLVPSNQNGLDLTKTPVGSVLLPGYTVVDKGDGTYTATFGSDITSNTNAPYDATATTRIAITVTSIAVPGVTATGPINPATNAVNTNFNEVNRAALIYDFTPKTGLVLADATGKATFARDIVTPDACEQCHYKMVKIASGGAESGGHTGSRPSTRVCVMCHTSTNTSGEGEYVNFIHRIHMGDELPAAVKAENVLNPTKLLAKTATLVGYDAAFPQKITNCIKCHKGTDVDAWNTNPSRKACGACHNGIDFATGKGTPLNTAFTAFGHVGGSQTDDSNCAKCHDGAKIKGYHQSNEVTPNNPSVPAGIAQFAYNIVSAKIDASGHPVIQFTFTNNGNAVTLDSVPSLRRQPMGKQGFSGGPTIGVYFAVAQDKIAKPVDYNASLTASLLNLWNSSGGTLAKNADGSFTATLTSGTVPTTANIVTAVVYGAILQSTESPAYASYSTGKENRTLHPAAGLAPTASTKAIGTARRVIVDTAKCNNCHDKLGTKPNFHGTTDTVNNVYDPGPRNLGTMCAFCHTANRTSGGWTAASNSYIHAIHAATKRSVKFAWDASSATDGFYNVKYPGYLRDCEQCHVAGSYDFANTSGDVPSMLYRTVASGTFNGADATKSFTFSPYVSTDNVANYGAVFSYNATTGATTEATSATLVSSPIASSCYSCHDTALAKTHMTLNGGSIYEARGTALLKSEACLVCHGTAQNTLNSTVPTIKAVHRWW